jgi:hypothetical protein
VADTLGAALGIDDVVVLALTDGLIGTFRLTDIAVDALVGDEERHGGSE